MTAQRDIAPPAMVDEVRAQMDALRMPCPVCGTILVSARAFSAATGAYLGLACTACEQVYQVEAKR